MRHTIIHMFGSNVIRTEKKLENEELLIFVRIHEVFNIIFSRMVDLIRGPISCLFQIDNAWSIGKRFKEKYESDSNKCREDLSRRWYEAFINSANSLNTILYKLAYDINGLINFENEIKILDMEYESLFKKGLVGESKKIRLLDGKLKKELLKELEKTGAASFIGEKKVDKVIEEVEGKLREWFNEYKSETLERLGSILRKESEEVRAIPNNNIVNMSKEKILDFRPYAERAKKIISDYKKIGESINKKFAKELRLIYDIDVKLTKRVKQLRKIEINEMLMHKHKFDEIRETFKRTGNHVKRQLATEELLSKMKQDDKVKNKIIDAIAFHDWKIFK